MPNFIEIGPVVSESIFMQTNNIQIIPFYNISVDELYSNLKIN